MKKFSSISNYSVPEEPKVEINKEQLKKDTLKSKLIGLMNDLLKVQSVGSARTELLNSAITVSGKEVLADAIIDLLSGEFNNQKINLLESMKSEMNDWLFLDKKIDQINSQTIFENNSKLKSIERKLIAFIDLYGDESAFELHTEMLLNRLTKKSELKERLMVVDLILNQGKLEQKQQRQIKLLGEKIKQKVTKLNS